MAGPVDFVTIENAIWNWVWSSSGLAAAQVMWASQNQPGLNAPYITLRIGTIATIGLSDSVELRLNPTPSPGAEILFIGRGQRRCTLTITCYGTTPIGATGAAAILDQVLGALSLDPIASPLSAAGIGIASYHDIVSIDGVVNSTLLEPRASIDVIFFIGSEITVTGTNIISVDITDQIPATPEKTTVHS